MEPVSIIIVATRAIVDGQHSKDPFVPTVGIWS